MTSAEFTRWAAFLSLEPDIGTRADWLATNLACHLGRIEATLGGSLLEIQGKMIDWGRTEETDEREVLKKIKAIAGNHG